MKAYLINMHLLVPRSRSSARSRSNINVTFLKKWPFRGHSCFTNTSCFFLNTENTYGRCSILLAQCYTQLLSSDLVHPYIHSFLNLFALWLVRHIIIIISNRSFLSLAPLTNATLLLSTFSLYYDTVSTFRLHRCRFQS